MIDPQPKTTRQLTTGVAVMKNLAGSVQLQQLELIAELDDRKVWRVDGAKSMAEWVSAQFGISQWAARRWIAAGHAVANLPEVRRALRGGHLSLDKVLELTRLATPDTETQLIAWANRVSAAAIRRKADLAQRDDIDEVRAGDRARSLSWWYEDGRRLWLEGFLPAEQGAVVTAALERLADKLPAEPGSEPGSTVEARRADALVALCSQQVTSDPDPARAAVSLHVDLAALAAGGSVELEGRGALHPAVAAMLCCDARVQAVLHDPLGQVVGLGHSSRNVSEALKRQLSHRDGDCCTFPGCQQKRYVDAHHIWPWEWGGPTDLDNLTLVCKFHHRLIHIHGWRVALGKQPGVVHWFRPNNRLFEPSSTGPVAA